MRVGSSDVLLEKCEQKKADQTTESSENLLRSNVNDEVHNTSDPIYEEYRLHELEGKTRLKLIFALSLGLAALGVLCIGIFQYDEYFAFVNDRFDYIANTKSFCDRIEVANIDIVSTPIAAFLLLLYILIYKRRVFLRKKFRYRNVGVPMMTSMWNKSQRLFSCFTYGLIAFEVFNIVRTSIDENKTSSSQLLSGVNDPTGLAKLSLKIVDMFVIGIRYYPVLVAYRANTFLINFTCAIYMWVDFVENLYEYGKCESISSEDVPDKEELRRRLPYYIVYKVFSAVPLCVFCSFIVISLTYKCIIRLIDFILKYKSDKMRARMIEQSRDSFFCLLGNVDDDNEIIFSNCDIDYVLQLLSKHKEPCDKNEPEIKQPEFVEVVEEEKAPNNQQLVSLHNKYVWVSEKKPVSRVKKLADAIYKWDVTFRFTSRYLNTITVSLVALYYVFLFWTYKISMIMSYLVAKIPDELLVDNLYVYPGEILCAINEQVCLEQLREMGGIKLPLPKSVVDFTPSLKSSILAVFIVPAFGAFLLCLGQVFLLIKETREHLRELYQGKCEYVKKAANLKNSKIASTSFHFGGFTVGYLIWGYLIIYIAVVVVGIAIIFIRIFIGDKLFLQIFMRCIPVILVIIVKLLVNKIATNYAFMDKKLKVLALINFRAFNVFLYFNFYFDCFMGIISAVIRLILSLVISIFMMPRVSYSFLGRHFENLDKGYATYSGFLHMEAMHTNPIIRCFCSILYYKDLAEHIRRYRLKKRAIVQKVDLDKMELKLNPLSRRLSVGENVNCTHASPKFYKRHVLIRWHVLLRLSLNRELVILRKHNFKKKRPQPEPESLLNKLKTKCVNICNRRKTSPADDKSAPI